MGKMTNSYRQVPCSEIKINRADRQRSEIETSDIEPSIKKFGVINPIILERDLTLVAGERRLTASLRLGLQTIPCRFADELTSAEHKQLELEENIRRKDLPWRDTVKAISELHEIYLAGDPEWTQAQTADALWLGPAMISQALRIWRDFSSERIAAAPTMAAAYNILARVDGRRIGDAMSSLAEAAGRGFQGLKLRATGMADGGVAMGTGPAGSATESTENGPHSDSTPAAPPESILHADFRTWAESYSGPRFNLIHCDFPYGIDAFAGPQSGRDSATVYDDGEEVYWELIKTLTRNLDKLMAVSGHMMFWLSADAGIVWRTLEEFRVAAPSLNFNLKPLVWHKSDNSGVLSDPNRGPRHIYETCLMASRGDRFIVKAKSDVYSAPIDRTYHTSTKPEPMLRHFFEMFCDENTTLLDPTCGSGAALRAAESLGAKSVLGLEKDPEHVANARSALRKFRATRAASETTA